MPTYEYLCDNCGHQFSIRQKMTEDALRECPKCHEPALKRLLFPVGVLKSTSAMVISEADSQRQEPDRITLAHRRPEKFDELLARERDVGGRLPVDVVD